MKDVYVILAFHAHELLWDLPGILLSRLGDRDPMKDTLLDENYLKKRKEEDRDIYSLCSRFGDSLGAPLSVEYSNELLCQVREVLPDTFQRMKEDFRRGRLYPLYGHAHHTHVSLLGPEELTQEITWNMHYLHQFMQVPYPRYRGLFPAEASLSSQKIEGITGANVDYVIFPHLDEEKVPFEIIGRGSYKYRPFLVKAGRRDLLALPRNFPISQEIWRPITKMKRDAVKNQGYMLGEFPVFKEEYLGDFREKHPISMEEGVEIYQKVLHQELGQVPPGGLLVYIQDLELMDYGDIALEIMEKAWKGVLQQEEEDIRIHFVTPDQYIDQVLKEEGISRLPEVRFKEINWAPEIRPVLRVDGHYPPLGVTGVGRYSTKKTGLHEKPHIFWENGKYYCGIFDTLLKNFNVSINLPLDGTWLNDMEYQLDRQNYQVRSLLLHRLMKRACNWGWRPTEGRQKLPCLKGYLICSTLLERLEKGPPEMVVSQEYQDLDPRHIAGLVELLEVFIDNRVRYLEYGMEELAREDGGVDLEKARAQLGPVFSWKEEAVQKALALYRVNRGQGGEAWEKAGETLALLRDYSRAVFMSTEYIQRTWAHIPRVDFMVDKMYLYLYDLYPPLFPSLVQAIDAMTLEDLEGYFARKERLVGVS